MAVSVEFLKSLAYFAGLSFNQLNTIASFIFEKAVPRREIILLEGRPPEALYFVVSGVVKVFQTSSEGKEQILNLVRPGEPFSDVAVFDGGVNPTGAQAMSAVTLYGIKKEDIETIMHDYPQVALNVTRILAGRVRQLMSLVEDFSFRHVVARVAKILLENAGDPHARLTQQEMAAMAGTAREVVGRSLKTLETSGAIRLDRHRVVITNREALKRLVESQ